MSLCPRCEQLPQWINEELSGVARADLEEHVETCAHCQCELESLFSGDSSSVSVSRSGGTIAEQMTQDIDPQFVDRLLSEGPRQDALEEVDFQRHDMAVPEQIGDYRILREIGRGGMGVVYEAEQCSLGRQVALKVLPRFLYGGKNAAARFQREARAAAQMHHVNIVPVFEVGSEDGYFFYAMQLIQGRSLNDLIHQWRHVREQPSDDDASSSAGHRQHCQLVARIALQVARALEYAHTQDVIHRDIKPSNLILDENDAVWVTDFGLAKTSNEEMTQTGDFLGTLRYMSPERFAGVCNPQTDIYALGITLYELLALRPAFEQQDRLQLIDIIRQVDPPPPSSFDRRIPRDLETIVLKALEKEPQSRYVSADEMADDLKRFLHDEPVQARRTSLAERLARWVRRNRKSGLAAAIAALIGAASFAGLNLVFNQPSSALPATGPNAQPANLESDNSRDSTERVLEITRTLLQRGARIYATTSEGTVSMTQPNHIPDESFGIGIVDLSSAELLEESVVLVREIPKLSELWIKDTSLSEATLNAIAAARSLEAIVLSGSDLDDAGVDRFIGMPRLKELMVDRTQVTASAARRFNGLQGRNVVNMRHFQ